MASSWRDTLPIHPACELFPPMSPDELAALGKDIRKNGLTSSIALWGDGRSPLQLLDGRSRLDAIEIAIGPAIVGAPSISAGKDWLACNRVITLDTSVDPYAYVISANIRRRHLSAEQQRELIAKLIKATPEKSDRQIAETVKVDHKTVGAVRAEQERRGEIPRVETRTDSKGRKQPRRKPRGPNAEQAKEAGRILGRLERADEAVQRHFIRHLPAEMLAARDDIGPASSGEIERKDARISRISGCAPKLRKPRPCPSSARAMPRATNSATCFAHGTAHRRAYGRSSKRARGSSQSTGSTFPHRCAGPRHEVVLWRAVYDLQISRIISSNQRGECNHKDSKLKIAPITVGNPAAAASLAIDQSHLEEYTSAEEQSSIVECKRPPKGVYFTVQPEPPGEPWSNRAFYFLLELEGRDPYIVAPAIAKAKEDEDVIRPVLLVRYVTMAGQEGLWPLKINRPDAKSNMWNESALNILSIAESGKWVRIVSAKKHYRHIVSPRTFDEVPPKFSDRSFNELVDISYKDRTVITLDHEIWDVLASGSTK
jgi:hypothetical protein